MNPIYVESGKKGDSIVSVKLILFRSLMKKKDSLSINSKKCRFGASVSNSPFGTMTFVIMK